jgi:uncharacterized protein
MMLKAFVLATALAVASAGAATAQDAGYANWAAGFRAYDRGDYAEAVRVWRIAGDQGSVDAQFFLGKMYTDGQGVAQNDTEASHWFRRAADQGDAVSQYSLGFNYANGRGVPRNEAEAVRWYRMAADQGLAGAQLNLGVMYANGRGVPQNHVEAYKWFALSAAQGNANAVTARDLVARLMTPAQIAEAQRLAAAWQPR